VDRWRSELEAWALPAGLLAAVPDSPHGWPTHLWRRMQERSDTQTPTTVVLVDLLAPGGTLLDVGAGTGRASLPAASRGHALTAVEPDPGLAEGFRHAVALAGVEARLIEASWPGAAGEAGPHDVALAANVVYDVAEVAPFLEALDRAAGRAVVVEATARHPLSSLTPYFRALHGLDRPRGPTADLLVEVIAEVLGRAPEAEQWERTTSIRFADLQELLDHYRRRLVLPEERTGELADLLAPDIQEDDGWLTLAGDRRQVTLWWRTGAAA
jgi:2-polyprenyl-3-methyl-5-hydroxy-6-metoxy-1,4-benzoquinol methylase